MSTPNPERTFNQQPTQFGVHEIKPKSRLVKPQTPEEARLWILEMALPEIAAYDGSPCQREMVEEEAIKWWPRLFGVEVEVEDKPEELSVEAVRQSDYFDRYTNDRGEIDWNRVARDTIYAVATQPLPEDLTITDQNVTIQSKLPETVAV